MITQYTDVLLDEIHEIEIQFCFYDDLGMDKEQIEFIKEVVKEYLKEYPATGISKICDYYSWDYDDAFSEFNYSHNREGKLYLDMKAMAQYGCDKVIGFNHIRIHGMQLENKKIISRIEELAKKINDITNCYKNKKKIAEINGQKIPGITEISRNAFGGSLDKHEIYKQNLSIDDYDVILIRLLEESLFLRRIIIHEIGHAIADAYSIDKNPEIIRLYEKYKFGFKNIDEFIAECFMASELTDKIPLANLVKKQIVLEKNKWDC